MAREFRPVRPNRFGSGLGLIALAALAIRVAFVIVVDPEVPAVGDATAYHMLAENLAEGRGYIRPYDFSLLHRVRETAEYPPLHPGLIAIVDLLGGDSVKTQRLTLGALGSVTVILVGLLGRRVGGPSAGLIAASVAAIHPMLFLPDATLMPETLFALLVTLALLLACQRAEGGRSPSPPRAPPIRSSRLRWRPDLRVFALLGVVIGLAALTRVEGLLLLPFLAWPLTVVGGMHWRKALLLAAVSTVGAAAVILPWTARNWVVFSAFVPISNNVGSVLGANCDQAYYGEQTGLWIFDCFGGFDVDEQDEASSAVQKRRQGLDYAFDHQRRWPTLMSVRWLRTWGLYQHEQQIYFESFEGRPLQWLRWGTWMHWAVLALAAGGAAVLRRERVRIWPLLSTGGVVSLTAVLIYGQQRFRITAEPAMAVLAGVFISRVAHWRR